MSGRAFWAAVGALMVAGCAARPNLIERSWTISLEPEPVDLSTGNEQEARRPKNAIGDPSIKTAFVISGEAAWEAIWKHAGREAPEIDFSGCFIIGTVRELSEPGILSVRITKVENTGDSLLVHIWEKWDAPGEPDTGAILGLQGHYVLVRRQSKEPPFISDLDGSERTILPPELPQRFLLGTYWDEKQLPREHRSTEK